MMKMILKKLKIENIFGIFDYEININDDITIITAPNGYGKTFCLKIIHGANGYNCIDRETGFFG